VVAEPLVTNGDAVVLDGFEKFTRPAAGELVAAALRDGVVAPPVNWPYSAEIPEVSTCVSSNAFSTGASEGSSNG
jgi:hypothetical protein